MFPASTAWSLPWWMAKYIPFSPHLQTQLNAQCPSDMNKLDVILAKKCDVQDQNLQYCLDTLHAWIRFLEYFLHVAYRKEIRKWLAHGTAAKEAVKARQRYIQAELRSRLSITVDFPRDGGSGT